jgi:hypothetical protein
MFCYNAVYNSIGIQFRFHVSIDGVLTSPWIASCIFPGSVVSSEGCLAACEQFKTYILASLFADDLKALDDLHTTNRISVLYRVAV